MSQEDALGSFVQLTSELIEMEKNAEVSKTQEDMKLASEKSQQTSGNTLFNLRCSGVEGGFMGRSLVTLTTTRMESKGVHAELPPHKFGPHDLVELRGNKGGTASEPVASGIVYRCRDREIIITVDEVPEEGLDQALRLDRIVNEVTYQRLQKTLEDLKRADLGKQMPGAHIVALAFNKSVAPVISSGTSPWTPTNKQLDMEQRKAVEMALSAHHLALIHGPPGTGKTTTVVEYIFQEIARGNRVLACAASNVAVDNLVDRLARHKKTNAIVVRLGHPARLLPQVLGCSLEAHVLRSDNSSLARDCRKEIKALNAKFQKLENWKKAEKRQIRQELQALAKEERKRQQKAIGEVLGNANVIAATLTGSMGHHLKDQVFDVVVIDEAAQALEVSCWGAILRGKKVVLAGDHLQLPPTVMSEEAAKKGLATTLFEKLKKKFSSKICTMLTMQYRMNESIMNWSSQEMYKSKLVAHPSVAHHNLQGLEEANPEVLQEFGDLVLLDTAGCDCEEEIGEDGVSRANPGEAAAVMRHVGKLLEGGIKPVDIGIITPYNAQVSTLRELRTDQMSGLEISSVDGFQGREKEAILISMVRSNVNGNVGFLSDHRRMNVAVTRARRHCAIICDTETVSKNAFLGRLTSYFEDNGEYLSATDHNANE